MNPRRSQLPVGVQDFLQGECELKRKIETKAIACFKAWGCSEVDTPCLEYMDLFSEGIGSFHQEQMFKLTDASGRLLVLRPDITMPLARIASARMGNADSLRLCYCGNAFQFTGSEAAGGIREFTQLGVEFMGLSGTRVDAELIALALATMDEIGVEGFQIEIGQVQFFKGLMEEAGFSPDQIEEIRLQVEAKNMLAIELLMQRAGASEDMLNTIRELPVLYGGPEVLDKARSLTNHPRCLQALQEVADLLQALDDYGLADRVSVDLGMVQSINYYSGIIIRGITRSVGHPILTGGRYDTLLEEFGKPMAATGFAFSVLPVMNALQRQQGSIASSAVDVVAYIAPGCEKRAYAAISDMRREGLNVEIYYGAPQQLEAYAEQKGAGKAIRFNDLESPMGGKS